MSVLLQEPEPSTRACRHEDVELLGTQGTATFYACAGCGGVVIVQAGGRWFLPRMDPP